MSSNVTLRTWDASQGFIEKACCTCICECCFSSDFPMEIQRGASLGAQWERERLMVRVALCRLKGGCLKLMHSK